MEDILVPIFVCVVLPIAIVAIIYWQRINNDNKRSQILLKAIETNNDIDADKLAEALAKPRKTAKEILYSRLLTGCIFTLSGLVCEVFSLIAYINHFPGDSLDPIQIPGIFGGFLLAIGIAFLIVYFVTRKQVIGEKEEK